MLHVTFILSIFYRKLPTPLKKSNRYRCKFDAYKFYKFTETPNTSIPPLSSDIAKFTISKKMNLIIIFIDKTR